MRTMKLIFQKWLVLLVLASMILSVGVIYLIQTSEAKLQAGDQISERLLSVSEKISSNQQSLEFMKRRESTSILDRARAASDLLKDDPTRVEDQNYLKTLVERLGLNGIYISDEKGTIVANYPNNSIGFNLGDLEESSKYLQILEDDALEIAEEPRVVSSEKTGGKELYQQFAAVARPDQKGILQVSQSGTNFDNMLSVADIEKVAKDVSVGIKGFVFIYRDDMVVSTGKSDLKRKKISELAMQMEKDGSFTMEFQGKSYIGKDITQDGYHLAGVIPEDEVYESRNQICMILLSATLGIYLIIYIMISLLLERVVMRGIRKTQEGLGRITDGNLDQVIDVHTNKEFDSLSNGINSMVGELKNAIERESKRWEEELRVAKEIQLAALPRLMPPYIDREEFVIDATMRTAKDVGGDFYDFFFTDEEHLAFLVADVSGKGIPAALFMMQAKTMIKNLTETGLTPSEVIEHANANLHENNKKGMFVTTWFGLLNITNGELTYINAGHNPPMLIQDGHSQWLKKRSGLLLGSFGESKYRSHELVMKTGDTLVLYTDGITEAMNLEEQQYGNERLANVLDAPVTNPKEVLNRILKSVDQFVGDAQQADDMTLVAVTYGKAQNMMQKTTTVEWVFPAVKEEYDHVEEHILDFLTKEGCELRRQKKILLAVEEIFVNIASYGYPESDGTVRIMLSYQRDDKKLHLVFCDEGIAFNPLQKKPTEYSKDMEELPIGGLGIQMVKRLMTNVRYERTADGKNILSMDNEA